MGRYKRKTCYFFLLSFYVRQTTNGVFPFRSEHFGEIPSMYPPGSVHSFSMDTLLQQQRAVAAMSGGYFPANDIACYLTASPANGVHLPGYMAIGASNRPPLLPSQAAMQLAQHPNAAAHFQGRHPSCVHGCSSSVACISPSAKGLAMGLAAIRPSSPGGLLQYPGSPLASPNSHMKVHPHLNSMHQGKCGHRNYNFLCLRCLILTTQTHYKLFFFLFLFSSFDTRLTATPSAGSDWLVSSSLRPHLSQAASFLGRHVHARKRSRTSFSHAQVRIRKGLHDRMLLSFVFIPAQNPINNYY